MKRTIYILTLLLLTTNSFSQFTKRVIKKDELNETAYKMLSSALDSLKLIEWIECKNFGQGAKAVSENQDTLVMFYSPKSMTQRPHLDFFYKVDISTVDDWVKKDFSKVNSSNDRMTVFENNSRKYKYYLEVDSKPEKKVYNFTYD